MHVLGWTAFDILARNWALVTMLSTIGAIVLIAMLVIRKYVRISLNILRTTKPPLSRSPLDYLRLQGEALTFPAFDGSRLSGMMVRAPADVVRRGMIIFAHTSACPSNTHGR